MTVTEEMMSAMTFGCELEYEGISQATAAKTVAETVGGTARFEGTHLSNWVVEMPDGRKWQVVSDGSLCGTASETVTPILKVADIPQLQEVVRALKRNGAKVNHRTGLHIHVGAQGMTPAQIKNAVRIFYKQETLIFKAIGTQEVRLGHYTRPTDRAFVDRICEMHNPTMEKLNAAWFGTYTPNPAHYDEHRYRSLNLNNLWGYRAKHTLEFRCFEGTLHAGVLRTNVLLALLIVLKAKSAKAASAKNPRPYSEASARYDLRVFLLRLGMIGDYYKNPRMHLMKRMPGSAAWKDGRHDRPRANAAEANG